MLNILHRTKTKARISNLLLSIKLVIKSYKNLIFGKRGFSYTFLIYALRHKAKPKTSALAKLNMNFKIKFLQKLRQDKYPTIGSLHKFNSLACHKFTTAYFANKQMVSNFKNLSALQLTFR